MRLGKRKIRLRNIRIGLRRKKKKKERKLEKLEKSVLILDLP